MIETCEESGSYDLPAYLEALRRGSASVDFVVGLDSGCGDYERLWVTTSLRGLAAGTLTVDVLTEGVHSGDASGIVPSSFRIARKLLDRLEDSGTGCVLPSAFHVQIPAERVEQATRRRRDHGRHRCSTSIRSPAARSRWSHDRAEALLNRTWRPALSVIGADGLPAIANAGNVLRPRTSLKLSLRLPPTRRRRHGDARHESAARSRSAARREGDVRGRPGRDRLECAADARRGSRDGARRRVAAHYGKPAAAMGEGGTIPFMAMLGEHFPARAVPDHRRAGPEVQRARAERIPRTCRTRRG